MDTEGIAASPLRCCERVTVTKVVLVEGSARGDDPVREITYYYGDDGKLIVRRDPWLEANPPMETLPG